MDDLKKHRIRKNGEYTPDDVLEKAADIIKKAGAKSVIVLVEGEDEILYRYNTELSIVELLGLFEFAKMQEME
ncbi:hypothetical protein K7T73_12540 [Bacillus badius]|uniref:hypothetical protein n=1 Tax=Bacillus badius TaxID=1455 RepID=UPI001CC116B3|nr:hypothetical protein [Bacillus badius]UAT29428.1 hypothetical protein K7T73_12540 [Bacillus badius]